MLFAFILNTNAQNPPTDYIKIYRKLSVLPINDSASIDSLFILGYIISVKQADSAQNIANDFLERANSNYTNHYFLAKANLYNAMILNDREKNIEAINSFNTAIKFFDKNKPSKDLCYTYQTLSYLYSKMNNPQLSDKMLLLGLNMAKQLKNSYLLGNTYNALGAKYNRENLCIKGKEMFRFSINYRKQTKNDYGLASAYLNIGISCRNINEFDSSMYYINKALNLAIKTKSEYNESYAYSDKGATFLLMDKIDSAIYYLKKAETIRLKIDEKRELASTYFYLGDCYVKQKNLNTAMQYYHKAEQLYKETSNTKGLYESYNQMSVAFSKFKLFDSAFVYQKKHQSVKDSLSIINNNQSTDALIASFQFEEKEKTIQLLNSEKQTQDLKIKNQQQLLTISIGGVLLMIIVIAMIIYTKEQKQKKYLLEASLKEEALKRVETEKLQQEKQRISRDLHDNVGGQLSYILYSLEDIKNDDKQKRIELSNNINESVRQVISNLRETIWAINEEDLSVTDLSDKLKMYTRQLFKNSKTKVSFNESIIEDIKLKSLLGLNLFRMCQEIINNAFKYAQATELTIVIRAQQQIEIEISDNGVGFNVSEVSEDSYGLKNIASRAGESNITINSSSVISQGTTYSLVV